MPGCGCYPFRLASGSLVVCWSREMKSWMSELLWFNIWLSWLFCASAVAYYCLSKFWIFGKLPAPAE